MGKRWSRKRKAEERKQKMGNDGGSTCRKEYTPALQSNAKMEAYYAAQGLHDHRLADADDGAASSECEFVPCRSDAEREAERVRWISSLRTILPASFRLGTDLDPGLRDKLERELDEFAGKEIEIEVAAEAGRGWNGPPASASVVESGAASSSAPAKEEGAAPADAAEEGTKGTTGAAVGDSPSAAAPQTKTRLVAPAVRVPYVPHAYQLSVDRRTIRRNPALTALHDWLKVHTSAGMLTRQETVSMIPPVVLGAEPGHAILDMCAAPGSKTSQLLEVVAQMEDGMAEPTGFVVANDSDPKRAYMLVHQLRRMNSPAVFVSSVDAQFFPNLVKGENGQEGTFDRVLCDVPCSGDGTTRKNPGMWKNWTQLGALSLHPLQLSIALNGCRLTKVGGYLCYSTCSMNPVENEAVVAEILRVSDGAMELVDRREDMPGLKARPGWTKWRVMREDRTNSQARKQRKNFEKKNNAKMRQRRKEWEEKRKREEGREEEIEGGDQKKTGGDAAPDKEMDEAEEKKADAAPEQNDAGDDSQKNEADPSPRAQSPSWDSDALVARARSAGLVLHETYDSVPEEWRRRVRASCFPPTLEEADGFHLERCMRCCPQDMDTGGFFVALFRKVAPMRARARRVAEELARENNPDAVADDNAAGKGEGAPKAKKQKTDDRGAKAKEGSAVDEIGDESIVESTSAGEVEDSAIEPEPDSGVEGDESKPLQSNDPAAADSAKSGDNADKGKPLLRGRGKTRGGLGNEKFIPIDDAMWAPLINFYGLSLDSFPRDQIMARACGDAKVMYFVSRSIKTQLMDRGLQERITTINSGLKAFERNSKVCEINYRVTQEAIHFVAPHMTKRKLVVSMDDFAKCIGHGGIKIGSFSDEFAKDARELSPGSFVVALKGFEHNVAKKMFLVMWRCRGDALNCLVSQVEMDGMKSKLKALKADLEVGMDVEKSDDVKPESEKQTGDAET